ncbi:hypothetical protein CBD41_08825 [bacterium TMED181]|nr:MAG: hypothetical protein CBD41_08825 [bacterium TMED181]
MINPKEVSFEQGVQRIYKFDNGYGASAVMHEYSYGGPKGLWELAVLDSNGDLCYHTPVTQDVIGHLDDSQLQLILKEISEFTSIYID